MFYTPAPIVDYLVSLSLRQLLAERSADDLNQLRVLDPSCGCGAFLLGCFRFLFEWYDQQLGKSDAELASRRSTQLMLQAFHGCDIDSRALIWTERLLLLAAWQGVRYSGDLSGVSVPDFKPGLRCTSFLEPASGGTSALPEPQYDAIIGGPPFVRLQSLHRSQEDRLRYYRRRFLSARRGQFDLYMLFIEQALDMLKPGGLLAFSLSNSFLRSDSGRIIRGYVAANASVEEVLEFDDPRTYEDANTQIVLLRLRKKTRIDGRYVLVRGRGRLRQKLDHLVSGRADSDITVVPLQSDATSSSRWNTAGESDSRWLTSVQKIGVSLGQVVTAENGLSTGSDDILLLDRIGSTSSGILIARRRGERGTVRLEAASVRSVVRGHQLTVT